MAVALMGGCVGVGGRVRGQLGGRQQGGRPHLRVRALPVGLERQLLLEELGLVPLQQLVQLRVHALHVVHLRYGTARYGGWASERGLSRRRGVGTSWRGMLERA
jgi:hypothetical protein